MKAYKNYFTTVALIWAACFTVFLFAYLLVLVPQAKSRQLIEEKLLEKKQKYQSVTKAAQEETRTRTRQEIEQLQGRLKDFVVGFEDAANLTFDISQIADQMKLADFSIKGKNAGTTLSLLPNCNYLYESRLEIGFTAGFNQCAAFLNALERHRPVLFVDSFTIERSKQAESSCQASMNVAVFVRKQQEF